MERSCKSKRGGSKKDDATTSEMTAQIGSPSKGAKNRKDSWDWKLIIKSRPGILGLILVFLLVVFVVYQKLPEKESKGKVGESPPVQVSFNFTGHALFVFGDSTVDAGNFGFTAHPYGIDYKGMTPRFTNGRTIADYLAVKMGTSIPQAYNSLGPDQLKDKSININFASAGCGLLSKTNPPDIPCTSMSDQVIQMVNARPGDSDRGSAVYFVSVGANDFIFSFKGPFDDNPERFSEMLVSKMESYMKLLVTYGGAKIFLINNLAPVGCIPNKSNCTRFCDEKINEGVKAFNLKLVATLKNFRKDYDVTILLADSVRMFAELVYYPWDFGLKNITHPCCGVWNANAHRFDCRNETQFCLNRNEYLFFDGAHLTQNANKVFVDYCIKGTVCYPIESV